MLRQGDLKAPKVMLLRLSEIQALYPNLKWSFYFEFNRRFEVVKYLNDYVNKNNAVVCDIGSQPFILTAMMKEIGYNVIAVDIEPDRFKKILELFDIPAVKADLEKDRIAIDNEFCDCVVFSEVLEHFSPYYVSHALTEINRITKTGGI
jgi:2-polyprenyl-3-methyl-5-hydroxy-6-metoxy-1,4-benzoquinol methylase